MLNASKYQCTSLHISYSGTLLAAKGLPVEILTGLITHRRQNVWRSLPDQLPYSCASGQFFACPAKPYLPAEKGRTDWHRELSGAEVTSSYYKCSVMGCVAFPTKVHFPHHVPRLPYSR